MPVKSDVDVCVGDSVSLEAEIVTDQDRLDILWYHGDKYDIVENDEHFNMTTDSLKKTVLDIRNTLPSHDSKYFVKAQEHGNIYKFHALQFNLEVHGKIILNVAQYTNLYLPM